MAIKTGIYLISPWGSSQVLTRQDHIITLTQRGPHTDRHQQWFVQHLEDDIFAIQNPANIFPSSSLSYQGEAEAGKRIIPGPTSDFPTRKWKIEQAPQRPLPVPYFIRVPDADLGVVVSPAKIFPPQIVLAPSAPGIGQAWAFEPVHSE